MSKQMIVLPEVVNATLTNLANGDTVQLYVLENNVEDSYDGVAYDVKMTNGPAVAIGTRKPANPRVMAGNTPELRQFIKNYSRNSSGGLRYRKADSLGNIIVYEAIIEDITQLKPKGNEHGIDITLMGKVVS